MNNTLGRACPCTDEESCILGAVDAALSANVTHAILRTIALLASADSVLLEDLWLGQSDWLVLAAIVRCVFARDPRRSVWAYKATLASGAGLSESTVYRALRRLAAAGMILRKNQERRSLGGRLSVARVRLTEVAARVLGLIGVLQPSGHRAGPAPCPGSDP